MPSETTTRPGDHAGAERVGEIIARADGHGNAGAKPGQRRPRALEFAGDRLGAIDLGQLARVDPEQPAELGVEPAVPEVVEHGGGGDGVIQHSRPVSRATR